ncbi:MAG: GNAT family N-acetyltransferase [Maritimibacter sp.]|nr:GNAT family N-acetyltransferase [Maritimibacter sp.]
MRVFTRPATSADTRQMADLAGPDVNAERIADWMAQAGTAWFLMENDDGEVLGFQQIAPGQDLPNDACVIATFLAQRNLPPGAAAALFDTTAEAARRLHYTWVSAGIDPANAAARIYYQNRGFRLYSAQTDRILMRFDLD